MAHPWAFTISPILQLGAKETDAEYVTQNCLESAYAREFSLVFNECHGGERMEVGAICELPSAFTTRGEPRTP